MNAKLTWALLVSSCLCGAAGTNAGQIPQLSKDQRTLLQAVVAAVDAAAQQPPTADVTWPTHVMRASDGSHYVAFSVAPPASTPLPAGPVLLYVRLASAAPGVTTTAVERSAIRDWLAGNSAAPPPPANRGIALGEMPAMGAAGNLSLRPTAATGLTDLQLMALERARARERQEKRDQQRRAELQGQAVTSRNNLPFEDFDLSSYKARADGSRNIERALTAGPGDYTLVVAWADPAAPNPAQTVRLLRRSLSLPPAATASLTLSSVIVADAVRLRATAYSPAEQGSHPYSIGLTEIEPSSDAVFTSDESLAVAFQVINARASDTGKPDIAVAFRVVRLVEKRETPVASLNPQHYTDATMPPDFDLRQGHPIFVAMAAPLATLPRGAYRLKINVNDRVIGAATTGDVDFRVIGTPRSLLAEAPPLGPPFRREAVLAPAVLHPIVQALTPATPSPALSRALAIAASGRLIDLLVEEPVPANEHGIRVALTGLALYAVGDASSGVQFQRALLLGAPIAPARFLAGAARAMQGRDVDAIAAWEEAASAGAPKTLTAPFLLDAYLRRNDYKRAAAIVAATTEAPATAEWMRGTAVARIASENYADAITVLEALLARQPHDAEAQWLLLHATYARMVNSGTAAVVSLYRDRFMTLAQTYIDANGTHAQLAKEWLNAVQKK